MAASAVLAIGINCFLAPYRVLDGGMIGIGLICKYLWGVKAGFTILLLSVPIFALAWFYDRDYFYNSVYGMLISSFFIDLLQPLQFKFLACVRLDPLSSSIVGGILVGWGIGMMLRHETSTGGTDLLAQLLASVFRINVGVLIFMIDAMVISLGGWLISKETLLLSLITITAVGLTTSLCTWKISENA
ncbi:Uncharacterised 5xTM membrane BCR, YitT family COG1284 [Lihuaxuella thermophila]|uniref:Uncharacterized 5xTM membrane BCR, YitT family COG1284 n=2 Tax=Lihuaxuella thermophila TaxID=1173111 RepID=A0A1H8CFV1_9BACL|nr:Uncharacterised 5xTM membrane BCR, YitT family COG1284 [Lihuaxuella thermophila]